MSDHKFTVEQREIIDFKKRGFVRRLTQKAMKEGILKKAAFCELCGGKSGGICAHHIDYGRPYHIVWLCAKCHGKAHRAEHPLNPMNNKQTPLPDVCKSHEMVGVTFSLPIENFLVMQTEAKNRKVTMSKLLRDELLIKFPVANDQLDFIEEKKDDNTPTDKAEGISSMVTDQGVLLQSKCTRFPAIRRKGDICLRRVEKQFSAVL